MLKRICLLVTSLFVVFSLSACGSPTSNSATENSDAPMVRHVFIATIQEGASEEIVDELVGEMRALKDQVPEIEALTVAKTTGWVGMDNAVTMVVDCKDKASFDAFIASEPHQAVSARAGEAFDTSNFILCQIEY